MPEKAVISHRGEKYEIGRGKRFYGIWAVGAPYDAPVDRWPETRDGWGQAWMRFAAIEVPGTIAAVTRERKSLRDRLRRPVGGEAVAGGPVAGGPVGKGTVAKGTAVNVSSIGGSTSLGRGNFLYGVSKGGVEQLTRELAVAWAPRGIRGNAVAPCQIAPDGLRALSASPSAEGRLLDTFLRGIPLGRLVEPAEVAAAVAFLASDAAAMITGVVLPVDGGNLALNAGGTIGE